MLDRIRVELVDKDFKVIIIHRFNDEHGMSRSFSKCMINDLMSAVGSDGHLYPCNYHPRPGGATYGSIIDNSFKKIWEGKKRNELKTRLPHICPAVCDPFKNRANRLLNRIKDIYQYEGINRLEDYQREISIPSVKNANVIRG